MGVGIVGVDVDVTSLRTTLKHIAPDLEKELKATFKAEAERGADMVRARVPVRSGFLKASIQPKTQFLASRTRAQVTSLQGHGVSRYRWPQDTGRKNGISTMAGTQYVTAAAKTFLPQAAQAVQQDVSRILRALQ